MRKQAVEGSGGEVTLPVTPMLDMTFQLLFFFIMTFNPTPPEGALDMSLPLGEGQCVAGEPRARPAPDPEPEFPADLTVQVRAHADGVHNGEISAVAVKCIDADPETIKGATEAEMIENMVAHLRKKRDGLKTKEAIKIQGDGKLKVKAIIKVMDACRKAGFKDVSFVPPEGFGR